jgi:hypothetical protein
MPASLKLDVPPSMTEQEACWLALKEDPARWSGELRTAVNSVIEKRVCMNDDMILTLLGADGTNPSGTRNSPEGNAVDAQLRRLAAELSESSLAWRFVRRSRRILDTLAPAGTLRGRSWVRVKKLLGRTL